MEKKSFIPTVRLAETLIAVLAPLCSFVELPLSAKEMGLGLTAIFLALGGVVMGMIIRRSSDRPDIE